MRIPHTVCVFPVPGGPWTSVRGNGADDGADDGADVVGRRPSPPPRCRGRTSEGGAAADHRIAASCGSLKFCVEVLGQTAHATRASSRTRRRFARIVRGILASGGANIAARIGACNLLMLCNASYSCDADEVFAGASHHRRPSPEATPPSSRPLPPRRREGQVATVRASNRSSNPLERLQRHALATTKRLVPGFPSRGGGVRAHVRGVETTSSRLVEPRETRRARRNRARVGGFFAVHGPRPRVGLVRRGSSEDGDGLFGQSERNVSASRVSSHTSVRVAIRPAVFEGLESERELASLGRDSRHALRTLLAGLLHQHGLERADVQWRASRNSLSMSTSLSLSLLRRQSAGQALALGRRREVAASGLARRRAGRRAPAGHARALDGRRRGVDRETRLAGRVGAAHGERGGRPLGTREEYRGHASPSAKARRRRKGETSTRAVPDAQREPQPRA